MSEGRQQPFRVFIPPEMWAVLGAAIVAVNGTATDEKMDDLREAVADYLSRYGR